MTFNLPLTHSLHISSSSFLMSLLSVFYHLVYVTLHSSCLALTRDHSHMSLLPLSHCLYILVLAFFSFLTLLPLFIPSFCQRASFLKALTRDCKQKSPSSLFSFSVLYMFPCLSFFPHMSHSFAILFSLSSIHLCC